MRFSIAVAVACLMAVGVSAADPVQAAMKKQTLIPAQSLGSALQVLAKEREFQIVCRADLVANMQSVEVRGELTAEEALARLLSGTELTYRYLDEKTVTIVPVATAPAQKGKDDAAAVSREAQKDRGFWERFRVAEADAGDTAGVKEDSESSTKVEEIVVTAQKREERLQDVPISISVLKGDDLDRSTYQGVRDTLNTVPGVSISTNHNDSSMITIRGVSSIYARFSGSGISGYYLDTVPFALVKSSIVPDSNAYDLERIEALRGPQGTLYGAAALNGVVRVLTKDADLSEFELKARTSASRTDMSDSFNYRGDLAVNVPIVNEKLAARLVLGYQDQAGWIDRPNKRDANGVENSNVRLKINAQPAPDFSIGLLAWRSRIDRSGPLRGDKDGKTEVSNPEPNSDDFDAFSMKLGYDAPSFAVTSMTSYLNYEVESLTDFRPYGFPLTLHALGDSDVFSQELLINSTSSGPWKSTVGAIYRKGDDGVSNFYPEFSTTVPVEGYSDTSESYAVYGEVTRLLLSGKIELSAGLRYFSDQVGLENHLTEDSVSTTYDKVTPRFVLTWHPDENLTVYTSYAEGFRSGTQQSPTTAALGVPGSKPDTLKNYEAGAKGRLFGNLVSFDAAAYYMDWQDAPQLLTVIVNTPGGPIPGSALVNSESFSGLGVDLGLSVRPTNGLTLSANFNWNGLDSDADVFSGNTLVLAKGQRGGGSPEVTVGASGDYVFRLGGGGYEGQIYASANHVSKQLVHANGLGTYVGKPITVSNLRFSLLSPQKWQASIFIDNAFNDRSSSYIPGFAGPPPSGLSYMHTRPMPRTVGLQLETKF